MSNNNSILDNDDFLSDFVDDIKYDKGNKINTDENFDNLLDSLIDDNKTGLKKKGFFDDLNDGLKDTDNNTSNINLSNEIKVQNKVIKKGFFDDLEDDIDLESTLNIDNNSEIKTEKGNNIYQKFNEQKQREKEFDSEEKVEDSFPETEPDFIVDTLLNTEFDYSEEDNYIKKTKHGKEKIDNDDVSWNTYSGYTMSVPKPNLVKEEWGYINGGNLPNSLHESLSDNIGFKEKLTKEDYQKAKEVFEEKNTLPNNPLETEDSKKAIIGTSGLSLSDYLMLRRKPVGSTYKNEAEKAIAKAKEGNTEAWREDRYVKRVKKQKEERKKRREKLNNKKSQRVIFHSSPTERNIKKNKYESQILKNLGISQGDLEFMVSPKSILNEKEKLKLLSSGYFGTKKIRATGEHAPKVFATIGDIPILHFLDKFKYANTNIIATSIGKSVSRARGQLKKLYNLGLVNELLVYGAKKIWCLTETGSAFIGSDKPVPKRYLSSPVSLVERLYVNHVAACLWGNTVNALDLEDFPYYGRLFEGELVRGEDLLEESLMMSSMNKKIIELGVAPFQKTKFKGERFKVIRENWEIEWRKWENAGRPIQSPELLEGNEYMYMIFSNNDLTNKYVLPDLVAKRPRNEDGSPNNIAIEVERQVKSVDEYIKKLLVYQQDSRIYKQVVYITPNNRTARNIIEAAERINFERFNVIPPMNMKGVMRELDSWLI